MRCELHPRNANIYNRFYFYVILSVITGQFFIFLFLCNLATPELNVHNSNESLVFIDAVR